MWFRSLIIGLSNTIISNLCTLQLSLVVHVLETSFLYEQQHVNILDLLLLCNFIFKILTAFASQESRRQKMEFENDCKLNKGIYSVLSAARKTLTSLYLLCNIFGLLKKFPQTCVYSAIWLQTTWPLENTKNMENYIENYRTPLK